MNYPLYNLDYKRFEKLVASICMEILGTGVIVFSEGKDGGRDGKFTGTSCRFPSEKESWSGKFIIQAKFTSVINSSCSDSEFETIMKKEIKKIIKMKSNDLIDNYIVFTNRKLSGAKEPKIEKLVLQAIEGIKFHLIGNETIQHYLHDYPLIAKKHNLNSLLLPLEFYENDIRQVIIEFAKVKPKYEELQKIKSDLDKIPIEEKNRINNLSRQYYEDVLKKSYTHFLNIDMFLKDPQNNDYLDMFYNTVDDLQEQITIKRDDFHYFDQVLAFLYDKILDTNNEILVKNRTFIRVFLHYMYANCLIGKREDYVNA